MSWQVTFILIYKYRKSFRSPFPRLYCSVGWVTSLTDRWNTPTNRPDWPLIRLCWNSRHHGLSLSSPRPEGPSRWHGAVALLRRMMDVSPVLTDGRASRWTRRTVSAHFWPAQRRLTHRLFAPSVLILSPGMSSSRSEWSICSRRVPLDVLLLKGFWRF